MKALLFLITLTGFLQASAKEKKLILHDNGKVQYEYEVEGFMLDGEFSCYYESGKLKVKGGFTKNKKTGLWRVWDDNGLLRSERVYTDNLEFEIIFETDAKGTRLKQQPEQAKNNLNTLGHPLFMHRFLHDLSKNHNENIDLFSENGLASLVINNIQSGNLTAFTDKKMQSQVNIPSISCYNANDIVGFLVYEEYVCYEDEGPVMNNRIISICPVVTEKGLRKELGWINASDLKNMQTAVDQLNRIKDHQYVSRVIKTTVNDPSFRLRDVTHKENEQLRLMLVEFEAAAILYVIDHQTLASK